MMANNNQPDSGWSGRGDVRVEVPWARSAWGDAITLYGASNGTAKRNRNEIHHGLKWPPIDQFTHNSQPKTGGHNGEE